MDGNLTVDTIEWRVDDYLHFKKCGEITASPDEKCFGLNCVFCKTVFLKLESFQQHIQGQHSRELWALYFSADDSGDGEESEIGDCDVDMVSEVSEQQKRIDNIVKNLKVATMLESKITETNSSLSATPTLDVQTMEQSTMEAHIMEQPTMDIHTLEQHSIDEPIIDLPRIELPAVDLPTPNQPAMDLPTMELPIVTKPTVDYSDILALELPTLDFSTMDLPAIDLAPVDLPSVDLAPVDLNPLDEPIVDLPTVLSTCSPTPSPITLKETQPASLPPSPKQAPPIVAPLRTSLRRTPLRASRRTNDSRQYLDSLRKTPLTAHTTLAPLRPLENTEKIEKTELEQELNIYLTHADMNSVDVVLELTSLNIENMPDDIHSSDEMSDPLSNFEEYRRISKKHATSDGEMSPTYSTTSSPPYSTSSSPPHSASSMSNYEEDNSSQHSHESFGPDTDSKHNRDVISYILKAFKRNELIWNPHHPDYKYNGKKPHFNKIAKNLYNDLGYKMTGTDISNEIRRLRNIYRIELEKTECSNGKYLPKLWCFNEMDFMRKPIEMNRRKKNAVATVASISNMSTTYNTRNSQMRVTNNNAANNVAGDENIAECTTDKDSTYNSANDAADTDVDFVSIHEISARNTYKIIEIYKKYPALWHVDHPDFRSVTYRKEAMEKMKIDISNKIRLNLTVEKLEKFLKNLKTKYIAEKRTQINLRISPDLHEARYEFYETLSQFIDNHVGPYRCADCDKVLTTSDQYKIHKSMHDGTSPFVCAICKKGFSSTGNYSIHLRRHRGDLRFQCTECGKRVATTTELAVHMRSHTGEKPFECDICGKYFKSSSFLSIHKRMHKNEPSFICPVCNKAFYEKHKFVDHMNGHLDIRDKECNVCGKKFTSTNNLAKHMQLHSLIMKYHCPICPDRPFAQSAGLRSHMILIHSKDAKSPKLKPGYKPVKIAA